MNYLVAAIHRLKPNAQFSFTEDDYSTIEWINLDGTAPTQAQIDKAIADIKAEEADKANANAAAKAALLERLGLTAEEAALLIS